MPKNRVDRTAFSLRWRFAPLLVASVLSGCAVQPIQDPASLLASVPAAELSRANALETQGQVDEAAALYLELAPRAQAPAKAELRLQAAQAYLAGGRVSQARQTLDALEPAGLVGGQLERSRLLKAELALAAKQPKAAIAELNRLNTTLPKSLKIRRIGLLAAAQRLDNDPLASAESLLKLDALLDGPVRMTNQVSLVATLALISEDDVLKLIRSSRGPMKGWAEIAQLVQRQSADPKQLEAAYRQWHQGWTSHPALPGLVRAYTGEGPTGYATAQPLTVMLPNGGRFAAAAKAIRDGIEAANRADTVNQRPSLTFADSTKANRVRTLYASATTRGADYVIGPLEKPAVDALVDAKALQVPTLALNESTEAERRALNLFQFALSPENEAAEAANKGLSLGARRALVLHPDDAWGQRLATAFSAQWRAQGGSLLGQASFDPAWSSYNKTLDRLMAAQDADLLFLVATAEMARKIYPQIQATAKNPLIVISTSHVYSGRFDANADRALVGLYFVDIPWMLDLGGAGPLAHRAVMGQTASAAGPLARLYAMGIDAYRLAPQLSELAANPGAYVPGQTGGLAIDPLGRITRQLALGRFTETGPRLANGADRPDDSRAKTTAAVGSE
ncbi:penicillin-binding protein activator [Allochromatium palmeri]|uniref:ABC transporter substrate-binding protein n=1 Tax=Allochromatium palmeri TaxID=231048 RepID=A0A6N8ECS3_9GAMM|nr:penicillin-binding protein activator [Allochromatium palmeri]MTW22012.1 ABC transporter substrate-binding protein [Allochromatium palmeri]